MVSTDQEDEALAYTLELVGERWTLLIVRDLLLGPARFTDLSRGLPRLSRNLLTGRLRRLEKEGLVRRRELPPPAASQVYEITDEGWSLARIVAPLSIWGLRRLGRDRALRGFRASTFAIGMTVFADPAAAEGVEDTCQFDVDGESFHIEIADGDIRPYRGPAAKPDVVITTDPETCVAIMAGTLAPSDAVEAGRMRATGDVSAAMRLLEIFPGPSLPGETTQTRSESSHA